MTTQHQPNQYTQNKRTQESALCKGTQLLISVGHTALRLALSDKPAP